jgi:hypothetical protein
MQSFDRVAEKSLASLAIQTDGASNREWNMYGKPIPFSRIRHVGAEKITYF